MSSSSIFILILLSLRSTLFSAHHPLYVFFRMSFDDFIENFTNMDICHTISSSFFSFTKAYKESVFFGSWKKPHLSGGCGNYETFLQNPQVTYRKFKARFTLMLTLKVLVVTIDAQWKGMGDVGSARYKPALLPPCPTIRVLSYSR